MEKYWCCPHWKFGNWCKHNFTLADHARAIQQKENLLQKTDSDEDSDEDEEDWEIRLANLRIAKQQQIQEEKDRYNEKKKFFDEGRQILGYPWLCSGFKYCTPENGRLDYCLIEMEPSRIGSNMIPPQNAWSAPVSAPSSAVCNHLMQGIASCKFTGSNEVHKIGARTGVSTGNFNNIKSEVRMPWDQALGLPPSLEYVFIGSSNTVPSSPSYFCDPGDSGSMVFTDNGKWIGLIHGGSKKANTPGQLLTYVTDARAILDHMAQLVTERTKFRLPRN